MVEKRITTPILIMETDELYYAKCDKDNSWHWLFTGVSVSVRYWKSSGHKKAA